MRNLISSLMKKVKGLDPGKNIQLLVIQNHHRVVTRMNVRISIMLIRSILKLIVMRLVKNLTQVVTIKTLKPKQIQTINFHK